MTAATLAAGGRRGGLVARLGFPAAARVPLAGLAICAAILAGMYLKSDPLMLAGAGMALVGSLVSPSLGLVVLAFMAPLRPPPVIPAPGFDLILVVAILAGCVYRLPFERPVLRPGLPLVALVALFGYIFVQQLPELASGYAGEQAHDIGYLFFQLAAGVGTVIAAGFVLQGRPPYGVLAALVLSATFGAALAIVTADDVPLAGLQNLIARPDVGSRASGPFGNPNAFGQLVAYGAVLALGWLSVTRSRAVRTALIVTLVVMLYALSISLSRGAVVALLAGVITLAFVRSRTLGLVVLAASALAVTAGYPVFLAWRLSAEGSIASSALAGLASSDDSRLSAVLAGPALFALSPVFGIGFGQYKYWSSLVSDDGGGLVAHNWYGTVLAEQGITGIVLWAIVLVAVARWLRRRPADPRSVGAAMLVASMAGCLFLSVPLNFQIAVLPAIAITAALVADWAPASAMSVGDRAAAVRRPSGRLPTGPARATPAPPGGAGGA